MKDAPPELPPIPAPFRRRWREFRIQVLPWIGFAVLATLAACLWDDALLPDPVSPPQIDCQPNGSSKAAIRGPGQFGSMPSGSAVLSLSNYHHGGNGPKD